MTVGLVGLAIVSMPIEHALAEPVLRPDLADRVSGQEDVTFADLVRLVVPGTAGNETIDVRDIGSEARRGSRTGVDDGAAAYGRAGALGWK
jgi:hypothetical protein